MNRDNIKTKAEVNASASFLSPAGAYASQDKRKNSVQPAGDFNKKGFQKGHLFYKGGEKGWFKKGQTPWIKGKNHSLEARKKLSILNKGKKISEETKQKISKNNGRWLLGKTHTKEAKEKISKSGRGRTPWNKGKKCKYLNGNQHRKNKTPWNKGKKGFKLSEEIKKKISLSLSKEKSYLWKGGISFEPYSLDWTETLRISIRERDKYSCKICGLKQGDIIHAVHHIDYDKKNCNPENLVTLCKKCHAKTNHHREYWITKFKKIGGDINGK